MWRLFHFRLFLRILAGWLLNAAGLPGFVRECDYDATVCKAQISVRRGNLFTIVRVNGLDVHFHRLTGTIDGVGFSPTSDCTLATARQSTHLDGRPSGQRDTTQTENQSD